MKRFLSPGVGFFALTLSLLFAPGVRAENILPAGTRISLAPAPVLEFVIAADGPSILWVSAEAEGLRRISISTGTASSVMEFHDPRVNRGELALPLQEAGPVVVRIDSLGTGRLLLSSSYGMGAVASPEEILATALALPFEELPTEEYIEELEGSEEIPEEMVEPAPEVIVSPPVILPPVILPATDTPAPPSPAVEPETAPTPLTPTIEVSPAPPPITPSNNPRQLLFGDVVKGTLPDLAPYRVETYRFYVPNRAPFSVTVKGFVDFALVSQSGAYYENVLGEDTEKELRIATPMEDYYFVTVRGKGGYTLQVKEW